MVRNIVVLGGSSHPSLNAGICDKLGIPPGHVLLSKFSVGETRVEIKESVRGKDVYIIQPAGENVNDNLMELLIAISACKTASARKVTAVLPLFPYSRQNDIPYTPNKTGPLLSKSTNCYSKPDFPFAFESKPQTPHPDNPPTTGLFNGADGLHKDLAKMQFDESSPTSNGTHNARYANYGTKTPKRSNTLDSAKSSEMSTRLGNLSTTSLLNGTTHVEDAGAVFAASKETLPSKDSSFTPRPGYKQWIAQAGKLVADLITCAGADHVITMELHDPRSSSPPSYVFCFLADITKEYQGFFDIPVDNLYGRATLKGFIQTSIPNYGQAVIVSPDAGGAKRASAIADSLGMPFALIHKERRPTKITDRQNSTMMLVGDVASRTCIVVDDLADTSNTITRAAKLLKKEGAEKVYALITHGILSGDAIDKINASQLDKVIVTNSVPQAEHQKRCPKLVVLDVGHLFAEAIRRVHHGESLSVLFQYD